MNRKQMNDESQVSTVHAVHTHRRAFRLVTMLSSVMLWRVVDMPARTCAAPDPETEDRPPALAYFSVTTVTLGARTFVISFSSSNVLTAVVQSVCGEHDQIKGSR